MKSRTIGLNNERLLLFGAFSLNVIVVYFSMIRDVLGPFIVLDEPTYFNLARSIWNEFSYMGHGQYNPLYPLFISPVFFFSDVGTSYDIAKFLNVIFFSSAFFPLYALSKKMFEKVKFSIFIAFILVSLPWKVTTNMIWAEPLYYSLFCWSVLCFMHYLECKTLKRAILLGIILALLFLTKQAGVLLTIAVFVVFLHENLSFAPSKKAYIKLHFVVLLAFILTISPWLLRNLLISHGVQGVLGYAALVPRIWKGFVNPLALFAAFTFQISYLVVSLYFVFAAFFIVGFLKMDKHRWYFPLILLIFVYTIGVCFLVAFHRIERIDVAYGRYISTSLPFIIIFAIDFILNDNIKLYQGNFVLFCAVVVFFVSLIFSPIKNSLFAYGYVNNFDLAFLNDFLIGFNNLLWRPSEKITREVILGVGFILLLITVGFSLIRNIRARFLLVSLLLLFMLYAGARSGYYVHRIAMSTQRINSFLRHVASLNIDKSFLRTNITLNHRDYAWFGFYLPIWSQSASMDMDGSVSSKSEEISPSVRSDKTLYVIDNRPLSHDVKIQHHDLILYLVTQ